MSTTDPKPAEYDDINKPVLPDDATADEKLHFKLTGTLDLYKANREADEAARKITQARNEAAELTRLEVQLAHVREQNSRAAASLKQIEHEKANVHQHTAHLRERKEIVGGERLSTETRRVINRVFSLGAPHWTDDLQQNFVNTLLAMNPHSLARWTQEMLDGLAGDMYAANELTPQAIMRGFTGLKRIVGDTALRALEGTVDRKAIGGGYVPPPSPPPAGGANAVETSKKSKDKKLKARRVTPEVEDSDDEEESDAYDESPQGHPTMGRWEEDEDGE